MTLTTLILIILGVVVLALLIFGFSTGWNNLWDKVTQYGGGNSNVDTIRQACAISCSSGGGYSFDTEVRTVNFGDGYEYTGTCQTMTGQVDATKKGADNKTLSVGVDSC